MQTIEQIYELASRGLWFYIVDTPYDSLLDTDDEFNENIVILKYYKHTVEHCHYVEFD